MLERFRAFRDKLMAEDDMMPHSHVFDSAIHYTERPMSLACACGALLLRDPRTELWRELK